MTESIYILFSSDYELFFGENYLQEADILVRPTEDLLGTCEEIGVPMTLFADVACVWRYRELGVESDFPEQVESQLCSAVQRGHDVQLHLHPHWLTSKHDGGRWEMDGTRFKLSDIGFRMANDCCSVCAEDLVVRGRDYLNVLLRKASPDYNCIAFRAGGYGIQPREREVLAALIAAGFVIDSSVAPGMVYSSNVNRIDFRKTVTNNWIGPRYGLEQPDDTGVFEIPIAAYPESLPVTALRCAEYVARRIRGVAKGFLTEDRGQRPRGTGIQNVGLIHRAFSTLLHGSMFSLELSGAELDVDGLVAGTVRFIEENVGRSPNLFFSASCHPKAVYHSTTVAIREYWRRMKRLCGTQLQAISFQKAAAIVTNDGVPRRTGA